MIVGSENNENNENNRNSDNIGNSENCGNNIILKCGTKRLKIGDDQSEDITPAPLSSSFQLLRNELMDLQFIVNHLRKDISCTIESSRDALKAGIQSEVGLLVYSLMDESIREQLSLKEELKRIQEVNEVLLENEEAAMEEMAKLTIENESIKSKEADKSDVVSISYYVNVVEQAKKIILETETEVDGLETIIISTLKDILAKFNEKTRLLTAEICTLKLENERFQMEMEAYEQFKLANEQLKSVLCENEVKITELLESQNESELRMREILTVNCELMDLSEFKEAELIRTKESEIEILKAKESESSENELLKKTMTAQRIELERIKETLARERKISSLKISDLREQLSEQQNGNEVNEFID